MKNETVKKTAQFSKKRKRRILWQRVVSILAAITVFCTTYALILPAITMTVDGKTLDGGYTIVTDSAGYYTFQAEDAVVHNGTINTDGSQATGTGYVGGMQYDANDNDSITFNFYASAAENRIVKIWYNTANDRDVDVVVNGAKPVTVRTVTNDDWANQGGSFTTVEVSVALQDGLNTIVLQGCPTGDSESWVANIDKIEIEDPGDATIFATQAEWQAGDTTASAPEEVDPAVQTYTFEAEDYIVPSNGANPASEQANPNASGGAYVGYLGTEGGNELGYLEFKVNPGAGEYIMNVVAATNGDRDFYVSVNNGDGTQHTATSTNAWGAGTWEWEANAVRTQVPVNLTDGENTIKIYNDADPMPNIDCITLTPVASEESSDLVIEAEDMTIGGGAVEVDNQSASNGAYVGNIGDPNDSDANGYVEFQVYAAEAGDYPMDIYYILDGDRSFAVTVTNGNASNTAPVACANANSWEVPAADPVSPTVTLAAGINTIRIAGVTNAETGAVDVAPNVDKVEFAADTGIQLASVTTIEAEDAAKGAYTPNPNVENASGNAYISDLGYTIIDEATGTITEAGNYLEFTVFVKGDQDVNTVMEIAYGAGDVRTGFVDVNGTQVAALTFDNVAGWGVFTSIEAVELTLNPGVNTIKIYNTGKGDDASVGALPQIDCITFGDSAVAAVVTDELEAEGQTIVGGATVDNGLASNAQHVGNIGGGTNGYVQFTVYAAEAGTYPLDIYYVSSQNRQLAVTVNPDAGGEAQGYTAQAYAGDWLTPSPDPVAATVTLTPGENVIRIGGDGGDGPNLDWFQLTYPTGAIVTEAEWEKIELEQLSEQFNFTSKIEAEAINYTQDGVASNEDKEGGNPSGGYFAEKLGDNDGGNYLQFSVYSDAADVQTAILSMVYSTNDRSNAGDHDKRYAIVDVNGVEQDPLHLAPNSEDTWTDFTHDPAEMLIELNPGWNTIKIYNDTNTNNVVVNGIKIDNGKMANIDYVTVKAANPVTTAVLPPVSSTLTFEAEDVAVGGYAEWAYNPDTGGNADAQYASGQSFVGQLGGSADKGSIEFTVYSAVEQTVNMNIRYTKNGETKANLTVTNSGATVESQALTFPSTGSDGAAQNGNVTLTDYPVSITLKPGYNTIRLSHDTETMPNMDKIDIVSYDSKIYYNQYEYLLEKNILRFDFDAEDFETVDGQDYIYGEGRAESGEIIPVASSTGVQHAIDDEGNSVAYFDGTGGIVWFPNNPANANSTYEEGDLSNDPMSLIDKETGASTFSVWVKTDANENDTDYEVLAYTGLTEEEDGYSNGFNLVTRFSEKDQNANGYATVYYRDEAGSVDEPNKLRIKQRFVKEQWQLVTVVYEGTTAILYIDGEEAGRRDNIQDGHQLQDYLNSTLNRYLLGLEPDGKNNFKGYMDEFVVYDTALTQSEIQALYEARHQIKVVEATTVPGATVNLFNYTEMVNYLKLANWNENPTDTNALPDLWYSQDGNTTKRYDVDNWLADENYWRLQNTDDPAGLLIQHNRDGVNIGASSPIIKEGTDLQGLTNPGFRFFHQQYAGMDPEESSVDGSGYPFITGSNYGGPYFELFTDNALPNWFSLYSKGNVTVGADGYPQLNIHDDPGDDRVQDPKRDLSEYFTAEERTLAPYFNKDFDTRAQTGSNENARQTADGSLQPNEFYVTTMQNGGGLFQVTKDGYFEYDSAKNAAWYDSTAGVNGEGGFVLYDHVVRPMYENGTGNVQCGNFLPFNQILLSDEEALSPDTTESHVDCDVADNAGNAYQADIHYGENNQYTDEGAPRLQLNDPTDNWFGMTVEFDFYMPEGGLINGEPMIFDFYGDDDVYVIIDDQLVLNIGGIHGAMSGVINFQTGAVTYDDNRANTTLYDLFKDTEYADYVDATTGTFKDFTQHKLKFFYMERGGNISYCRLRFRMPTLPENSLTVQKQLEPAEASGELLLDNTVDYLFRVVASDATLNDATDDQLFVTQYADFNILDGVAVVGTGKTDANGIFRLKARQSAQFEDILTKFASTGVKEYVVQELIPVEYRGQYKIYDRETLATYSGTITIDGVEYDVYSSAPIAVDGTQVTRATGGFAIYDNQPQEPYSNLLITKTINDNALDAEELAEEFQMNVTLGGNPLPEGTEYYLYNSLADYDSGANLEVKKVVTGTSADGSRQISYITLKHGQVAEFRGILAGTVFSVNEVLREDQHYIEFYSAEQKTYNKVENSEDWVWDEKWSDFTLTTADDYAVGTIPLHSAVKVEVKNEPRNFAVEVPISKQVLDGVGSGTFHFTVQWVTDSTGNNPTDSDFTFPGANITVTDSVIQTGKIVLGFKSSDFPAENGPYYFKIAEEAGTGDYVYDGTYYVVEITIAANGQSANLTGVWKNGATKIDNPTADEPLAFVNQQLTTVLIRKTVLGETTSNKKFTFKITAKYKNGDEYVVDPSEVELAHGEQTSIKVPVGATVTVTETNPDGYFVSYETNQGTSGSDASATVTNVPVGTTMIHFTNQAGYELPETGGMGTHGYIMGGVALLGAAGWLLYRKLRNRGEGVTSL